MKKKIKNFLGRGLCC